MTKLSSWEYLGRIPNKPAPGVFGTSVIGERDTWIDLAPESEAATKRLSISQHQRCSGLSRAWPHWLPGCFTMFHWECLDAMKWLHPVASPGCCRLLQSQSFFPATSQATSQAVLGDLATSVLLTWRAKMIGPEFGWTSRPKFEGTGQLSQSSQDMQTICKLYSNVKKSINS